MDIDIALVPPVRNAPATRILTGPDQRIDDILLVGTVLRLGSPIVLGGLCPKIHSLIGVLEIVCSVEGCLG